MWVRKGRDNSTAVSVPMRRVSPAWWILIWSMEKDKMYRRVTVRHHLSIHKKKPTPRYSLAGRIHWVEFTTVVNHFGYDQILLELMDKRSDLGFKGKPLHNSASVPYTPDVEAIQDCGWAEAGTSGQHFIEGGSVGGNAIVDYVVVNCLSESKESASVKIHEDPKNDSI